MCVCVCACVRVCVCACENVYVCVCDCECVSVTRRIWQKEGIWVAALLLPAHAKRVTRCNIASCCFYYLIRKIPSALRITNTLETFFDKKYSRSVACSCRMQQHTATTHCNNTLQQHTATTHCNNTLQQHNATAHCNNTLQQHTFGMSRQSNIMRLMLLLLLHEKYSRSVAGSSIYSSHTHEWVTSHM